MLTEGAVLERVSREAPQLLDPSIGYAGLLAQDAGRELLATIWHEYASAAAPFPVVIHTPTWRCGRDRITKARDPLAQPERDAVKLIRATVPEARIAGLMGPKGDCYMPSQAPSREEARTHHAWQIERLSVAGCDFILAATLPSSEEARGVVDALQATATPYVLSFVLRADGAILDGTPLVDLIAEIDRSPAPPLGYWVNCTHPEVFGAGMRETRQVDAAAADRVQGFQANTSPRDPSEYDALSSLETMRPAEFGAALAALHSEFGLRVLGGCCGTRAQHIRAVAQALAREATS